MDFNMITNFIPIAFFGIFGISIFIFIFVFINIFSSKSRAKMMSKHVKAMKNMVDYSKNDLEDLMTDLGSISANVQNNIVNQNEDIFRNVANKTADINKDAIETTVSAIRKGWNGNNDSNTKNTVYCKYCGKKIDFDSTFCKFCGKQQ